MDIPIAGILRYQFSQKPHLQNIRLNYEDIHVMLLMYTYMYMLLFHGFYALCLNINHENWTPQTFSITWY